MNDDTPLYDLILDRIAFAYSVRLDIAMLPECGPWEYPA